MPDWMGERWGRVDMRVVLSRPDEDPVDRVGPGFDLQVRAVCHNCNGGWMSRLETTAQPYLIPMIEGRGKTLHAEGRRAVATWAVKTCMAFQGLARPRDRSIPVAHYRHMPLEDGPPRNTQAWLAALEDTGIDPQVSYHWHHGLKVQHDDAYGATLSIGHLAMQVIGIGHDDPMTRELYGWARDVLLAIWPGNESVTWLPKFILDIKGLTTLGSPEFVI